MNILKYVFNWKYRFFMKKISDVERSILEYEFKIAKSRQVREGVRQDRDRALESAKRLSVALTGATKDQTIDLEKQIATQEDNAKRFEAQMKMVDDQIQGTKPSESDPGQQGIIDIIASLTELLTMYKDYADKL